jgi:DNA-binding CsgD family transcriptional regulator
VPALARGDAERLLRFVADAESFGGDHPFEGEFLTQLGRLVRADHIDYADCWGCLGDGPGPHFARPEDEGVFHKDWAEIKPIVDAENPLLRHIWQGGAVKISDFFTRRELHRTCIYNLCFKPYDCEDVLAVRLRIRRRARPKQFIFDRGGCDFSERDRAVLDLLNPYLVQLHRVSDSRRRLRAALAIHESTRTAVVLLEEDDRVSFASTLAGELLDRYFGAMTVHLPDPLASWLQERRRATTGEPLTIKAGDRSLVVDLVDEALLLEERQCVPRLTARERDIIDLVTEGRTNAEIAERLWVSHATVKKHLDNIYAKLGVHTRTAAAAAIREQPRHPADGRS